MLENYSIVIIPTYNELDNISDIIDEIFSLNNNFHVLVVDDNSPDKTYRIVEEKIVEHKERLFLIKRDQKSGLGSAYMTAFDWVINSSNNYNRIYTMDADFSHNPNEIQTGLNLVAQGFDLVLGSRYPDGKIINWPLKRRIFSRFANLLCRMLISWKFHDYTNGYRFYNKKSLRFI